TTRARELGDVDLEVLLPRDPLLVGRHAPEDAFVRREVRALVAAVDVDRLEREDVRRLVLVRLVRVREEDAVVRGAEDRRVSARGDALGRPARRRDRVETGIA